jgi:hypothetical protein
MTAGWQGAPPTSAWTEAAEALRVAEFREGPPGPALEGVPLLRRLAAVDMAEGVAHDVKNQLTVVVAAVQMVSDRVPPEQAALLERASHCAMRAAQLMDELLRAARDAEAPPAATDVASALETAVAGAWGYCAARGVRLEMRLDPGLTTVAAPGGELRLLLLHAIRWLADLCPAETYLTADASPAGRGAAIRLTARAVGGAAHPWNPGAWPGVLCGLAAESGVRLGMEGHTPTLYLAREAAPAFPGSGQSVPASEVNGAGHGEDDLGQ